METKKLNPEILNNLKKIQKEGNELIDGFGLIEYQIQDLKLKKGLLIEKFKILKNQEKEVIEKLQSEYGDGKIDLDKGEFISMWFF